MRCFLTIVILGLLCIGGGVAFIYSGTYDVAASVPHNPVVAWVLETTSDNSVAHYAARVQVPRSLDQPQLVKAGAEHYGDDCEVCHGGPGVKRTDLSKGLLPSPPDLGESAQELSPAELFWVAKHGIKMTGMPAWGLTHSDSELWTVVAFLRKLHELSPQQYQTMAHPAGGHGKAEGGAAAPGGAGEGRPAPASR